MMGGEEDSEPGDRYTDRDDAEGEAMAEPVREIGDQHREAEGRGPGRHGMQLGPDGRVAVRLDDARCEECVAIGRDDEAEVHKSADKDLVVLENVEDIPRCDPPREAGAAAIAAVGAGAAVLVDTEA